MFDRDNAIEDVDDGDDSGTHLKEGASLGGRHAAANSGKERDCRL